MADLRISQLTAGTLNSTTLMPVCITTSDTRSIQVGQMPTGTYHVTGLVGANSTATPASQFSFRADSVELWKSADNSMRYVLNTSAIINNLGTTGNNGRDQVAAFGANAWVHLYFVGADNVTSSTLATRSSLTAPPTGPTLPSSETRWAYAGAVRNGAGAALLLTRFDGAWAYYDIGDGGVIRVLSNGQSTAFTAIDCSSVIPPNSFTGKFNMTLLGALSTVGNFANAAIRVTGSTGGGQFPGAVIQQVAAINVENIVNLCYPVSSSQAFDYFVQTGSGTGVGLYTDVHGYLMPNGGGD